MELIKRWGGVLQKEMRTSCCMHEFRATIVTRKMRPVKVKLKHQRSYKLSSEGGWGVGVQPAS